MANLIYIKNMVCDRCVMSVELALKSLSIDFKKVTLGDVEFHNEVSKDTLELLNNKLLEEGFEIVENSDEIIVERIKNKIIDLIYNKPENIETTVISTYLSSELNADYSIISKIFSTLTETTIEKYFIIQKVKRIKELISQNEMNISEIAFLLGYSSSQHLSSQFKKITGYSPSQYKKTLIPNL